MSRFPGIEAFILKALEEEGEVRPPKELLVQHWFWLAASALQSRGLVVADQAAGVVRRAASTVVYDGVDRKPFVLTIIDDPEEGLPPFATDLPARLRMLVIRWRTPRPISSEAYRQCAIDLEEVLEESKERKGLRSASRHDWTAFPDGPEGQPYLLHVTTLGTGDPAWNASPEELAKEVLRLAAPRPAPAEYLRHPTYGTLAELMEEIECNLGSGYYVRPGLIGALAWFTSQYQTAEPRANRHAEPEGGSA